ncbi:ABC transporter substrate-binding protein [Aequorivita vladivostokensis]|uniref:Iron ABC transporter n=1 Tax=Aequorivita vladivostokensis TaxID=171194 RepID=A0ABR5DHM3_9FLAO|nr:helical backbone metal receptor [Aequorivita vladivostokensis]KJJ38281.1 iron ABC transporter [Aequorivita vladivostokensis]
MEFIDQLNRTVTLPKTPSRVISLVPSQTELLVDLGLREKIVGITKFCVHPSDLKSEKTVVGGTKQVNFNKIKALRPDIVICNKEENTEELVGELSRIAPVWISDIVTITDNNRMIEQLGQIFDVVSKASEIVSKIDSELALFRNYIKGYSEKRVLYIIWKKPYMAAGRGTFIDSLLKENKYSNIFSVNAGRYPEVKQEDFLKADIILLSTEPYPFKNVDVVEMTKKLNREVKLVDGEFFSWYGSRLMKAFDYFKSLH